MKKLFSAILASVLLAVCNLALAQDSPPATKDTLYVNFLEDLDKGDVLPFKFIYQRAKIRQDTTITCSISHDLSFEVIENNKENQYVVFNIIQNNYQKQGPEANDPRYSSATFLWEDGESLELTVTYSGQMSVSESCGEPLFSKFSKNLDYIADTLASSQFVKEKLSREQWKELYSEMIDTNFIIWRAVSSFDDLFFFGAFDYEADSAYVLVDSTFCNYTGKPYYYYRQFGWDKTFSDEKEAFKDLYVFRSISRVEGIPFVETLYYPVKLTKEEIDGLMEKADPVRLVHIVELTVLADKGMGIPILLDKTTLDGYYDEIGDNSMKLVKEVLALDIEKLMAQENDDDEEEDDGEPRYDDYGFIKVK